MVTTKVPTYLRRYTKKEEKLAIDVPIALDCVRSISLSPWMHASLSKATVAAIRKIDDCERLKISRSTLISNEQWKALGQAAT
jgi:hypothetical protein